LFIRNLVEHNNEYNFLLWNLFLGFVPFLFALLINIFHTNLKKPLIIAGVLLWLLFYPNAPYMITDFIHVHSSSSYVVYDALLIFSFSMLSLFFGFYSIKLIEKTLYTYFNTKLVNIITIIALLLSSFGIYLGRILRLNSWDIFTHFIQTMQEILNHLFPPTKNPVTYLMIFLFTIIQWLMLNLIEKINNE
jgi:uncharacterized membrane protein